MTLYTLCGIPGSGKTTLANKIAEQRNATVHSYDDVPGANRGPDKDGIVRKAWVDGMRDDLLAGRSVVCDAPHLTVSERQQTLRDFADIPCEKILLLKSVPVEECLRRNAGRTARLPDFVITQAAEKLELPTLAEGWDGIKEVHDE